MPHQKWTVIASVGIGGVVAVATWYWLKRRRMLHCHSSPWRCGRLRRKIHIISTVEQWEQVAPQVLQDLEKLPVLGLDCEWSNDGGRAHPVSLLQLSTSDFCCVLVRLHLLKTIPQSLQRILQARGILKVGVGVLDDAKKLSRDYGLFLQGCVDLRHMAARHRGLHTGIGLKGLASQIVGQTLEKSFVVRCSDWEAEFLSEKQAEYAAADAYIAVEIFMEIVHSKLMKQQGEGGDNMTNDAVRSKMASMCQGILDVNFKDGGQKNKDAGQKNQNQGTSGRKKSDSAIRAYSCRKKPLYHNCQLQAPDGQPLCTCDTKKAEWYIEKGLGEIVSEDPLTIRLTFEPSGRPESAKNYYLQEKQNICVVCGSTDSYIRKNVVPREYRKYFPSIMKDHSSHDVVLMCLTCHQRTCDQDSRLKYQLANQCDAPISSGAIHKTFQDPDLHRLRSSAKALMYSGDRIPQARRDELEMVVKDYFGTTDLDEDLLQQAVDIDIKIPNDNFVPHGLKVVQYMVEHESLLAFEKLWRKHFLETMEPKHLPSLWDVDHNHDRLQGMDERLHNALGGES